jgi:hypothetical protein
MIREKDMEKIIEDIKDLFYQEVDVDYLDLELDKSIHAEVNEGKFFFRLQDYLNNILNNNEVKKEVLPPQIDLGIIQKGLNYRQCLSFVRNRGYGWDLPTIDDFLNLTSQQKSSFDEDIFWSSTPYDDKNMWCFSFIKNKKIIMEKGFYCNVCLKRTI